LCTIQSVFETGKPNQETGMNLKDKTLFISGASRGIGRAIGERAAADGANIILFAKTATPDPRLPGTIHDAAEAMEKAGGKTLVCVGDLRDEAQLDEAVAKGAEHFGGIDILINNASAISLTGTESTSMKKYDLMHQINGRGTFMASQKCLPWLKKAANPHVLNLSPPLNLSPRWFANHPAYTAAKYLMSLWVLGMAEEYRGKVAFNALWPKTAINTAAVQNHLGGARSVVAAREPAIMADAAYAILLRDARHCSGNFFIDEAVLREEGVTDFRSYQVDPDLPEEQLLPDLFLD
jgi:citronellol/citronellal dehydrogenase